MTVERRGEGPEILAFHSSGKWSLTSAPAFDDNVRRMRRSGRTLGTRTEATAAAFDHEIHWPGDGWGHYHPKGDLGRDCATEWEHAAWDLKDRGVAPLTATRIHTEKGHLQPPVCLTWSLVEHRETGIELELGAGHLDLDNTALRRLANLEECHALRARARHDQDAHPRRRHLWQLDGNRDQRNPHWQAYFARELTAGTRLRSGWHAPLPRQGTHGRALLDLAFADFPHTSRLIADDPSSDHRPFETTGHL